ncbi:MAG: carboxylesterase family protein [bacterium]
MEKKKLTTAFFMLAACVLLLSPGSTLSAMVDCSEPVETEQGAIKGYADADESACVWKGIPYAAQPVGDLRFRAPEPPPSHQGVLKAFEYGPACPQDSTIYSGGDVEDCDEACLTLNIWRPKKPGTYPVMYWIHGGAFKQGSGTYEMSDGARLAAEQEVIVITMDYRVGILGFTALPELAEEDPHGSTGNYGILDQIRGLKWVQNNIAAFGGDPDNVTVFGQSAGGMSVCTLLATPLAEGLFHRAIPMSGSCNTASTLEEGYQQGEKILEEVGCDGAADVVKCLRDKPQEAFVPKGQNTILTMVSGGMGFGPHMDGYVLADQPLDYIKRGDYNRVPVMVGHTRDEIKLYTMFFAGLSLWPEWWVDHILEWLLGPRKDEVMAMYSYDDYDRPVHLLYAVANQAFVAQGFAAAEALAEHSPVYFYRFDWDDTRFRKKMGAFHGLDEPMVFGALEMDTDLANLLANDRAIELGEPMSAKIMAYYANFAKTGDPNGPGLPRWPRYTRETRKRLYLDNNITAKPLTQKQIERYSYFGKYGMDELKESMGEE